MWKSGRVEWCLSALFWSRCETPGKWVNLGLQAAQMADERKFLYSAPGQLPPVVPSGALQMFTTCNPKSFHRPSLSPLSHLLRHGRNIKVIEVNPQLPALA